MNVVFRQRSAVAAALLFAAIPLIRWYTLRLGDGGETEGLVPLAAGLFFWIRDRKSLEPSSAGIWLLAVYALAYPFLPGLVRATLFVIAFCLIAGIWKKPGTVLLLLLALPWAASLDFFLGYPLRLLTSVNSAFLVSLSGTEVTRQGVMLLHGGNAVGVDPACSGLNLLWSAGLLTGLLAAVFRLRRRGIILLALAAITVSLVGNTLRAAILFFPEAGLLSMPHILHSCTGLIIAGLAFFPLILLARRISPAPGIPGNPRPLHPWPVCAVALLAGITPLLSVQENSRTTTPSVTLTEFEGKPIVSIPLTTAEEKFYNGFPGSVTVYEGDGFKLITRRVNRATRKLHPASHCLRAEGFEIGEKTVAGSDGENWLTYAIRRNGNEFRVRESISNPCSGTRWPEISRWFWHALFHPDQGPWEAVTLISG